MPEEPNKPVETIEQPAIAQPAPVTEPPKTNKTASLKNKKLLGIPLVVIIIALLVIGGSAGAYFGIIVPNRPENALKTSVQKLLQKKQVATKGSVSVDPKNAEVKNVTVNFKGASDTEKQAFSAEIEAAASGVKLPFEMRGVDKNLYFRVGDLGSVTGLAGLTGNQEASSMIKAIGDKLSNQWIEVDESLIKQAGSDCSLDLASGFSKQDVDEIMKVYSENSFVNIKGTSSDKVDGRSATKYELGIDEQKATAFGDKVANVGVLKKINDCAKASDKTGGDAEVKDDAKKALEEADFSLFVWVDGGKNLRQIEMKGSDKDVTATITITFTDDKVDIQKPEGAKPVMELLGDFSQLFGGIPIGGLSGQTIPTSGMSAECEAAFQAYITSGGTSQLPNNCL